MVTIAKKVSNAAKNIAAATALLAIKKKYGKPTPEPKPDDEKETAALVEKLEQASRALSMAVAGLVSRASRGGVANSELVRQTEAVNSLAKSIK